MNKIVLASASPRRKELMEQIGLVFQVCSSTCEEKAEGSDPASIVCGLSRQKAEDVFKKEWENREELLVIGADTVVSFRGKVLGKPKDEKEACDMLSALSGNVHEVFTGVTFCYRKEGRDVSHTFFEKTEVVFYPMDRKEIEDYVATKDSMDKAGAYGIQGRCAAFIKEIRGDYNNVVGLPIGRLYQEMKECFGK